MSGLALRDKCSVMRRDQGHCVLRAVLRVVGGFSRRLVDPRSGGADFGNENELYKHWIDKNKLVQVTFLSMAMRDVVNRIKKKNIFLI